ncbi:transcriptional regulator SlyA [Anaerotignum neopropionicum]|uniref:Transcriptional regulator SlyA n=1 Tax=Anaerotignum neopropionicum TaxID=36847 RepID=A0A136WFT0_9FIRM|nr:MarR family transcriptional regulator [Anaerotignum neopropionicum]KXL53317.1 transcriptional regulator SlyA [Anaerotignum neopropionicum]
MQANLELMEQFFLISRLMHRNHYQKNRFSEKESFRGQGRVLSILNNNPGICQKELSQLLDIRSQSMGEVIKKLERNGYIFRTPCENDHRAIRIFLTPQGINAAKFMRRNMEDAATLFDCLNEEEKNNLQQYLSRIVFEIEHVLSSDSGKEE